MNRLLLVLVLALSVVACKTPKCVRTEKQTVHHPADDIGTILWITGSSPAYLALNHPAYDAVEDVCVEWEMPR